MIAFPVFLEIPIWFSSVLSALAPGDLHDSCSRTIQKVCGGGALTEPAGTVTAPAGDVLCISA